VRQRRTPTFALVTALVSFFLATNAHANHFTATVETLQGHPGTNGGYVRLTGQPTFEGDGCTNYWAKGLLDDEQFMIYMWPLLITVKRHGVTVTVGVEGCNEGYPRISWVQVNPT
jgi:hypothetical protein